MPDPARLQKPVIGVTVITTINIVIGEAREVQHGQLRPDSCRSASRTGYDQARRWGQRDPQAEAEVQQPAHYSNRAEQRVRCPVDDNRRPTQNAKQVFVCDSGLRLTQG